LRQSVPSRFQRRYKRTLTLLRSTRFAFLNLVLSIVKIFSWIRNSSPTPPSMNVSRSPSNYLSTTPYCKCTHQAGDSNVYVIFRHAQLLSNDKLLLITDDQRGAISIYLDSLSTIGNAVKNRRPRRVIRQDKIGKDINIAFDEIKRMLALHSCSKVCLVLYYATILGSENLFRNNSIFLCSTKAMRHFSHGPTLLICLAGVRLEQLSSDSVSLLAARSCCWLTIKVAPESSP